MINEFLKHEFNPVMFYGLIAGSLLGMGIYLAAVLSFVF